MNSHSENEYFASLNEQMFSDMFHNGSHPFNKMIVEAEPQVPRTFIPTLEEKRKAVFIPENLNIQDLLRDLRPKGFRPHPDRLRYLIGLFTELPSVDKRLLKKIQQAKEPIFIPLSSQLLKKKIHNYEMYLEYLINAEVIECDNHYIKGGKSKGYRLTTKYQTKVKKEDIQEVTLLDRNQADLGDEQDAPSFTRMKTFFEGLEIDYNAATSLLDEQYETSLISKQSHSCIPLYNSHKVMLDRISTKDYFFTRDSFSGRFHTSLTNLKSDYRKFLTYEKMNLVSIDLSNAQALLALNLLQENFYSGEGETTLINLDKISVNNQYNIQSPFQQPSFKLIYPIMCGTSVTPAIKEELDLYTKFAVSGQFYELCCEQFQPYYEAEISRDQVKRILFSVLFSENNENLEYIEANKDVFRQLFPFITSVFEAWKAIDHKQLSKVIQRIESFLFLDCIVPRVFEEIGQIPIFTIHDSLVTLEEFVDCVEGIMYDEIKRLIGFTPNFKTEAWSL